VASRALARRATPKGSIATCGFQEEERTPRPRDCRNTARRRAATNGPVPGAIRLAPLRRARRKTTFHTSEAAAMARVVPPSSM
jgi:hypothetical protein